MDSDDTVHISRSGCDEPTQGDAGAARPVIAVPKRLGAVQLVRQIGQGGMGVVWLGRHELLNRDVAVKFLLNLAADEDDPEFGALLEGARAAAAIHHKGLNAVLHADVIERVPFLVMEYVEGPTLSQLLHKCERLSPAVTRVVMESLCAAVGELHDNGVVHRDIKPSNVLLAMDGTPVLTDFGLACFKAGGELNFTVKGIAGTPVYMAPEMWEKQVSPRSDVYALGIMLYEMLVGEPPFDGDPDHLQQCHAEAPLPAEIMGQLGTSIAQVIERATTKNPVFRYKSARHFQRAVEEAFASMDAMVVAKARGQADLTQAIAKMTRGGGEVKVADTRESGGTYYDRLGTLAGVRKRTQVDEPGATPEKDLVERVERSLSCIRCKAELKGEPITGRCPNCLLLVRNSVAGVQGDSGSGWSQPPSKQGIAPPARKSPEAPAGAPPAASEPSKGVVANLRQFWKDLFSK